MSDIRRLLTSHCQDCAINIVGIESRTLVLVKLLIGHAWRHAYEDGHPLLEFATMADVKRFTKALFEVADAMGLPEGEPEVER